MADITMCNGEQCLDKEQCYRYTAPRSEYWQSMFSCSPALKGNCEYFWDNHERQKGKQVSTSHKL